jgi:hypothetical protein
VSNQNGSGKYNEYSRPAQVWVNSEKIVTFQDTPALQIYTERSFKDGSVKTQYFLKAGKP